jgi:hypothetical protein
MPNPMDAILARIERGNQERKANALNDIFAKAYQPGQPIPFVDEAAQAMGLPQEPGMVAGYQPGRIDVQNALAQMAQSPVKGMATQAFQLQQQMDAAKAAQQAPLEKLQMEYALRDALMNNQFDKAKAIMMDMGGSGGNYGTSMKITPRGPEIAFDPAKDASTRLDQAKYAMEYGAPAPGASVQPSSGYAPRGTVDAGQPANLPPKVAWDMKASMLGKQQDQLLKDYEALKTLPDTMSTLDQSMGAWEKAQAGGMLGSGADLKLGAAKFWNNNLGQLLGVQIAPEAVANVEYLRGTLFRQVLDNLKKMDASPSQQQQAVMQQSLGSIGTDPQAIPKLINLTKQILLNRASLHDKRVSEAQKIGIPFAYDIHVLPGLKQAGYADPTSESGKYRVNGLTKGPDGRMYLIRSLKADGTPDEVIPAQ